MHSNQKSGVAPESIPTVGSRVRRAAPFARVLLMVLALVAFAGCGDAVDKPEDCTSVEYFNDATKLCTACPAAVEPKCEAGCGFEIVRDDNSCPVAQCASQCRCESGEFFSDDTLSCTACAEATVELLICAE
ncbi:hypothetical protein [Bradymonas sediminis]|nr:hypothetical protein [Bradymonas sediminis]TDP77352.1 hypothetical protein DFR33_101252 [Bradymonas sediminis]